jgi:hypothetical protein
MPNFSEFPTFTNEGDIFVAVKTTRAKLHLASGARRLLETMPQAIEPDTARLVKPGWKKRNT